MKQNNEIIMDAIRERKKELGLSNGQFADLIGMERIAAIRTINGNNPKLVTILKMANAVGLKITLKKVDHRQ